MAVFQLSFSGSWLERAYADHRSYRQGKTHVAQASASISLFHKLFELHDFFLP